jgi:pimeloyl-ACP methyl ester carboxylesterase
MIRSESTSAGGAADPCSSRSPGLPVSHSPGLPLALADCLAQWRREAELGTLDTGRYRLRYFSWGRGPALVFVPGLCSDGMSFVMPMARLARHFRCVGYDLPAGGADGANLTAYRHDDLVADLLALLDHLRLRDPFLLGFSFGSTVTLAALARQPRRFPRAVLMGGMARRPLAPAEVFLCHWLRYLPGRIRDIRVLERLTHHNQYATFRDRPPEVWRFLLDRQGATPLRAFAARALMLHRLDLRSLLARVLQHVLLVCGACDPLVGKGCERDLMAGLPLAARAEIEACGHQAHLTHPEVLAELVRQFLLPPGCPA